MHSREKVKHHAALFDSLAEATGVDLQDKVLTGQVSMDELAESVLRCTACPDPEGCAEWVLAGGKSPPRFCQNRSRLQELAGDD